MNQISEVFLALLRAGIRGRRPEALPELRPDQWRELLSLAQAHKVLPLLFEPALPLLRSADPALAAAAKGQIRDQVIGQVIRTEQFLALYDSLEAVGVTPLVVKGIVCRQLYPKPDHRPSGDEDVLIPPEQFALCHKVMTGMGMTTSVPQQELQTSHEIPYRHPERPLYIELHKQLFPPESDAYGNFNAIVGDPFRRSVSMEIDGHVLRTMEPTDHMTYLLLHAFKHFLHSGFGIRQICDILLFAHQNRRIDWDRVTRSCKRVRAEKFAAAVFAVGVKHLGFAPIGPWPDVDEMPLLEDVLRAGVYGSAELSRLHSSTITLEAAAGKKAARAGALAAAFPSARKLEGRYPWLKKQPYLLPIAWADRMAVYLREIRNTPDSSLSDALKLGAERVELLRRYDILK